MKIIDLDMSNKNYKIIINKIIKVIAKTNIVHKNGLESIYGGLRYGF